MFYDNHATRLKALLITCKGIPPATPTIHAWQKVLQTTEMPVLMQRLGAFMALPQEVSEAVARTNPALKGSLSYPMSKIGNAISANNFSAQWQTFIAHIDDTVIESLNLISAILDNSSRVEFASSDALTDLRGKLDDALNGVLSSDVPQSVKVRMAKYLKDAINAVDEYFITGIDGLHEAMDKIAGQLATDEEVRNAVADNNDENGFAGSYYNAFMLFMSILQVATGMLQLPYAQDFIKRLGNG